MATSVDWLVTSAAPGFWDSIVAATFTPRPPCVGLTVPVEALASEPASCSWDRVSANSTRLALKPVVLTFAMLLPITSAMVWCARRPETAENIERIMIDELLWSFVRGLPSVAWGDSS